MKPTHTAAAAYNPSGAWIYVSNRAEQVPLSRALEFFSRGNYLYSLDGDPLVPFAMRNEAGELGDAAPLLILSNDVSHPPFDSTDANAGPHYVDHWRSMDDYAHARHVQEIEDHDKEAKARSEDDEEKQRKELIKANTFKGSSRYGRPQETMVKIGGPKLRKLQPGKKHRKGTYQGNPSMGAVLAQAHLDAAYQAQQQPQHTQGLTFTDPNVSAVSTQPSQPVFLQQNPAVGHSLYAHTSPVHSWHALSQQLQPMYGSQQQYSVYPSQQGSYMAPAVGNPQTLYSGQQTSHAYGVQMIGLHGHQVQQSNNLPAPTTAASINQSVSVPSTHHRIVSYSSSSSSSLNPTSPAFLPAAQGHPTEQRQRYHPQQYPSQQYQPFDHVASPPIGMGHGPGPSIANPPETFLQRDDQQRIFSPVVAVPVGAVVPGPSGYYNGGQNGDFSLGYQMQGMQQEDMQQQQISYAAAPFAGPNLGFPLQEPSFMAFQQAAQPALQHPPVQQAAPMPFQQTLQSPFHSPIQQRSDPYGFTMTAPPTTSNRRNYSGRGARQRHRDSRQQQLNQVSTRNQQSFSFLNDGHYGNIGESRGHGLGTREPPGHQRVASGASGTAYAIGGRIVPGGPAVPLQSLGAVERALSTEQNMRVEQEKMLAKGFFNG
ncbi:hypothetical protein K490DRAFT_68139 [Saccharata proteae CBS 121410]|uniref:Uncharacterized protein n=1 Tax=Saccharata proteae CBS 121410 TaxID=1314787 RepID=A0A9P4HQ76_9PEZI|nr:hypothetical protein K490DRAFT_68139 [Saccharata proteae CBS 121410]